MKLFIAPHNDDETLFGAFTLMREHPLVVIVTDSYIQQNRGDNITPQQRWQETVKAMKILECSVMRLGIRDDIVNEIAVTEKLACFKNFETVYAPAVQGGNPVHDLVGIVAAKVFKPYVKEFVTYSTYAKGEWYTKGNIQVGIRDGIRDIQTKNLALDCYKSQIELPATSGHFIAARSEKSEWYI